MLAIFAAIHRSPERQGQTAHPSAISAQGNGRGPRRSRSPRALGGEHSMILSSNRGLQRAGRERSTNRRPAAVRAIVALERLPGGDRRTSAGTAPGST
jgi:hypothetical protein